MKCRQDSIQKGQNAGLLKVEQPKIQIDEMEMFSKLYHNLSVLAKKFCYCYFTFQKSRFPDLKLCHFVHYASQELIISWPLRSELVVQSPQIIPVKSRIAWNVKQSANKLHVFMQVRKIQSLILTSKNCQWSSSTRNENSWQTFVLWLEVVWSSSFYTALT